MARPRISASVSESLNEDIEQLVEEDDTINSKAEAIRYLLERGFEADDLADKLETRENRIEQLEDQLRKRSNIEDEIEDVAERVEDLPAKIQQTESYTERRRRKLDQAGIAQRLKWRITGVPVETEDSETEM